MGRTTIQVFTLRPAVAADVRHVAKRMRPADRAECRAFSNAEPAATLRKSWQRALWCEAIDYGGEVVALYGLAPSANPMVGCPWMLGTPAVEHLGPAFVRACRPTLDLMLSSHPALLNFVQSKNTRSVRWLEWLGFEFLQPIVMVATGKEFLPFRMVRDQAARAASNDYLRSLGLDLECRPGPRAIARPRRRSGAAPQFVM
ncbi:hypothetical protein [Methylibium petroleiphilum]|uniref:hypothetical protein n=1 Tax=Methylibium petroleiphilum TaxID=105560 RepID=UPI003D2803A9